MQIEIVSVGTPYVKDRYGRLDFEYISGGKKMSRTLTAVGETKEVINRLKGAKPGESWDITLVKDGQYWNWVGAERIFDPDPSHSLESEKPKTHFQANTKGSWETPEERAARQVYIIKQSSLANALVFFQQFSANPTTVEDVLELAQEFTDWVLSSGEKPAAVPAKPTKATKAKHEVENSDPFKEE